MKRNHLSSSLARFAVRAYEMCVPSRIRTGLHNRWFTRHSARWARVRKTPQFVIHRVAPGVRMQLHGDSLLSEMLYFGEYEPETRIFFEAYLRPGDTFLDVGANIGFYTLLAARLVAPDGPVHAFEPCSETFSRLEENVHLNRPGNVSCHRVALSSENAQARLTLANGGYDAWNSLAAPSMGECGGSETVSTVTLDSFVREHGLSGRRCTIKIDVEGWEAQVLAGGREFLSGDEAPLLCVEFTEEAAALAGSSCAGLYRFLEDLGYRIFSINPQPLEVRPFPLPDIFPNVNMIATKNPAEIQARISMP